MIAEIILVIGLIACLIAVAFITREQRKVTRQLRKFAQVYFPAHIDAQVDAEGGNSKVEVEKLWDPERVGRD